MNKKSILFILLDLIFIAVFNTVFFVVGGAEHPASVWISYAFIHISYIMVLITPFLTRKTKSASVFGFALYSVSAVYFFAEFIIGLLFVLIRSEGYKAALVIQVILAGIYAIILLSNLIANEHTADNEEEREAEIAFVKNSASKLKLLMGKLSDKSADKLIERAYDLVHSSPTKTSPEVKSMESNVIDMIEDLEAAVHRDQVERAVRLTNEIISLTEERNSILKTRNG